jgi:hypothetical protein
LAYPGLYINRLFCCIICMLVRNFTCHFPVGRWDEVIEAKKLGITAETLCFAQSDMIDWFGTKALTYLKGGVPARDIDSRFHNVHK